MRIRVRAWVIRARSGGMEGCGWAGGPRFVPSLHLCPEKKQRLGSIPSSGGPTGSTGGGGRGLALTSNLKIFPQRAERKGISGFFTQTHNHRQREEKVRGTRAALPGPPARHRGGEGTDVLAVELVLGGAAQRGAEDAAGLGQVALADLEMGVEQPDLGEGEAAVGEHLEALLVHRPRPLHVLRGRVGGGGGRGAIWGTPRSRGDTPTETVARST